MTNPSTDIWTADAPGSDRALKRRYRVWRRVELDLEAGRLDLHATDGLVTRIDLDDVLIVAGLSKVTMMWRPMPMPVPVLGRVRIVTEDKTVQVALGSNDNTALFKLLSENCPNAVVIWRQGHVHAAGDYRNRLDADRRQLAANQARMLLREQWELSTVMMLLAMSMVAVVAAVIGMALDATGAAVVMVTLCVVAAGLFGWMGRRRLRRGLGALPRRPTEEAA